MALEILSLARESQMSHKCPGKQRHKDESSSFHPLCTLHRYMQTTYRRYTVNILIFIILSEKKKSTFVPAKAFTILTSWNENQAPMHSASSFMLWIFFFFPFFFSFLLLLMP